MSGGTFAAFLDIMRRIPAGKVATYGQIARLAGMPRSARLVGYAAASCRDPSVPCHRVVDRFGGTKAAFDVHAPGTQRALPARRDRGPGAVPMAGKESGALRVESGDSVWGESPLFTLHSPLCSEMSRVA